MKIKRGHHERTALRVPRGENVAASSAAAEDRRQATIAGEQEHQAQATQNLADRQHQSQPDLSGPYLEPRAAREPGTPLAG